MERNINVALTFENNNKIKHNIKSLKEQISSHIQCLMVNKQKKILKNPHKFVQNVSSQCTYNRKNIFKNKKFWKYRYNADGDSLICYAVTGLTIWSGSSQTCQFPISIAAGSVWDLSPSFTYP